MVLFYFCAVESSEVLKCAKNSLQSMKDYFIIKNGKCYNSMEKTIHSTKYLSRIFVKKPNNNFVLFRVVKGSGVNSYDYFLSNDQFNSFVNDSERNLSKNFKSILLKEWENIHPVTMNLTLRNDKDSVVAWLLFSVKKTDKLDEWFCQDSLIDSFPWKITEFKSHKYDIFSIYGMDKHRTFHIVKNLGYCEKDFGGLAIYEIKEVCEYIKTPSLPCIAYAEFNGHPSYFEKYIKYVKSIEIVGFYDKEFTFFV